MGATLAALEEQGRAEAEHDDGSHVSECHGAALDAGAKPAAGIDEHGVGDERRARACQARPTVKASGEPAPGLFQLRHEPGEARSRKQRAETAFGSPPPAGEAAADRAQPALSEGDRSDGRASREPVARSFPRDVEREDAESDSQRGDTEDRSPRPHAQIVPPQPRNANQGVP